MRLILRVLAVMFFLCTSHHVYAGKGDRVPSHEGVSAALAEILNSPERLTLAD